MKLFLIIWTMITGMSILVSSFMLFKKYSEFRTLRLQADNKEKDLTNLIAKIGIKELHQTQSGNELLELLGCDLSTTFEQDSATDVDTFAPNEVQSKSNNSKSSRKRGLNERHIRVLEFLAQYQSLYNRSPTLREIGEKVKISSTATVNDYLERLEKMGYIERDSHVARSVRLTGKVNQIIQGMGNYLRIPILGPIAAGIPLPELQVGSSYLYDSQEDALEIARSLLPLKETGEGLYALEIKGDSMIDAMINDSDIVVMKPATTARNGEMVAVWLPNNNEATLKYYFKEKDRIRLQPANPTMKPIFIKMDEPLEIKGKVIMVIRRMERSL